MKLAMVTGTVVSTQKLECFERRILLLLQPLEADRSPAGAPIVAVDTVQAGIGDLVIFEGGKEAAQAMENWFNPCDASVIGIVDDMYVEE